MNHQRRVDVVAEIEKNRTKTGTEKKIIKTTSSRKRSHLIRSDKRIQFEDSIENLSTMLKTSYQTIPETCIGKINVCNLSLNRIVSTRSLFIEIPNEFLALPFLSLHSPLPGLFNYSSCFLFE